ncbi:putative T6SS immunity periplasmic lipoprotein [Tatumella sp. UBA2305]|uniref:putative T6SS immunity periplasmic lipoprotein n=1 Tax=Tatumella sp. UBA2305 TaxID=1947647 RepID=UPI0025DFCF15|nr:putative T6SS immunity periplasmic lipoprotein [Tatumella sp. UBA2305]
MIKYFYMSFLFFLLSGCTGDRLVFRNKGNAVVSKDSICITSKPGDVLEYYMLSYSVNNYHPPLNMEEDIAKKYPETCIKTELKNNAAYGLIYTMSGKNYRFEFNIDANGKVTKV